MESHGAVRAREKQQVIRAEPQASYSTMAAWAGVVILVIAQIVTVAFLIGGLKQQVSDLANDVHDIKINMRQPATRSSEPTSATMHLQ